MALAEVVRNHEQGHSGPMVGELARPAQAKPGKALCEVADGQVAAFNVACANPVCVRIARYDVNGYADALRGAVAPNGVHYVNVLSRHTTC